MPYEGPTSYKEAGVDIAKSENAIESLVKRLNFSRKGIGEPYPLPNGFAGLVKFGDKALSMCTDGVGTKMMVAEAMDRFDTVGIDCIAMNVNDMICVGATPIAFVDYLAVCRPDERIITELGIGLNRGAELSNISIIGGETAELPDMIKGFDLAGTALGFVDMDKIIDGTRITPGNAIIGLPSSGVHSNGLTLARKIFEGAGLDYKDNESTLGRSIGDELLEPTTLYVKPILDLISKVNVLGMANITGGGLRNLLRMKKGVGYVIDNPLPVPRVFTLMEELSSIPPEELYVTFNMGLGYVAIVDNSDADRSVDILKSNGIEAKMIGMVTDTGTVVQDGMVFR